jgi:hypothetical protein
MARDREVLRAVQEVRACLSAVAAGAPELLVVGVEGAGDVGVQDPADIGLVDAHPEGDGGRHDARRAVEEGGHRLVARVLGDAGVVEDDVVAGGGERVARGFGIRVGGRVDDARAFEL